MPVTPTPLAGLASGTARFTETTLLTPGNLTAPDHRTPRNFPPAVCLEAAPGLLLGQHPGDGLYRGHSASSGPGSLRTARGRVVRRAPRRDIARARTTSAIRAV